MWYSKKHSLPIRKNLWRTLRYNMTMTSPKVNTHTSITVSDCYLARIILIFIVSSEKRLNSMQLFSFFSFLPFYRKFWHGNVSWYGRRYNRLCTLVLAWYIHDCMLKTKMESSCYGTTLFVQVMFSLFCFVFFFSHGIVSCWVWNKQK